MKDPDEKDKASLKQELQDAKAEIEHVGGLAAFKSGDWFFNLVRKCFRNYYDSATGDYFSAKYPGFSEDKLLSKITSVAARNAAIVGGWWASQCRRMRYPLFSPHCRPRGCQFPHR